jgi:hypothetical protein
MPEAFVWIPSSSQAFLNFNEFDNLRMSQGLTFPNGASSAEASWPWALSLHLLLMVFVTQIMRCDLLLWPCSTLAFSFGRYVVKKNMNSGWYLWSIPFHKRFWNRPQNLRCDLTVPYFCFPPFECLSTGHSSDGFGDRINCYFTRWIPTYLPQFSYLRLRFSRLSRPGRSLLRSERVIFLVDSLYAEAIETVKSQAALSASSHELIWILCEINSEAETSPNMWIW